VIGVVRTGAGRPSPFPALRFAFPAFTPGGWKIDEVAGNVLDLAASDGAGALLPVAKVDKQTWEIGKPKDGTVVVSARRLDLLEELTGHITSRGGHALAVRCDVESPDEVQALAAEVEASFGRCDILVNNAGIPGGGRFETLTEGQIERLVRVNVLGVMHSTHVFLPMMLTAGRGHILNIASIAGQHAVPSAALYSATKHAVTSFSEALSHEVIDRGVRVTSINPAFTRTPGFPQKGMPEAIVMPPEKVARAICRAVARDAGAQVSVPRWAGSLQLFRILGPLYRWGMRSIVRDRTRPQATPTD
jgi:short-subunit dehydrogenase